MKREEGQRKNKQTSNTIAIRIFRVMIILTITIAVFFTGTNAVYTIHMRKAQDDSLVTMAKHVSTGILRPLSKMTDQSTMSATEADAQAIDRFFSGCENTVQMIGLSAKGFYEADEPANEDVMLPTALTGEGVYRLNVTGFDITDSEKRHTLSVMSRLKNILNATYESDEDIASAYFSSPDGFTIVADDQAKEVIGENGRPLPFEAYTRDWYIQAINEKGVVFTPVKRDYYTGEAIVTCSMPVYSGETLVGVAAIDITTETITDILRTNLVENAQIAIVDDRGNLRISTTDFGMFGLKPDEHKNLYDVDTPTINAILQDATSGNHGRCSVLLGEDGKEIRRLDDKTLSSLSEEELRAYSEEMMKTVHYEIYYAPIPLLDWGLLFVADYTQLNEQTTKVMTVFMEQTMEQFKESDKIMQRGIFIDICLLLVILVLVYFVARDLSKRLSEPIVELTAKVRDINGDNLDFSWDRQDRDETAVLAEAFAEMTKKIRQYIVDLTTVTAEKERLGAELDVARRIQADMLPLDFPEGPEVDLFASMTPAKEVGGDFYDFFHIDDDHLGLVIADVSGKGVPAALFMVIAKTLIKNLAASEGRGPADVLTTANRVLCEGNEELLFVTVWIGILTISTGELICANAGHEYPILKKRGEAFCLLRGDKHDAPLAIKEDVVYQEYTLSLEPGDVLVLYTDGFPESTNENDEQFKEKRMLTALNEVQEDDPKALDEHLRRKIRFFTGKSAQFDDMTMMTVCYHGCGGTGKQDGTEAE